jgi:hypothetical protein
VTQQEFIFIQPPALTCQREALCAPVHLELRKLCKRDAAAAGIPTWDDNADAAVLASEMMRSIGRQVVSWPLDSSLQRWGCSGIPLSPSNSCEIGAGLSIQLPYWSAGALIWVGFGRERNDLPPLELDSRALQCPASDFRVMDGYELAGWSLKTGFIC